MTDTRTEQERRAQRRAALEEANRIRSYRARLKVDVKADATAQLAIGLIAHPEPEAATMLVIDVLYQVQGLGKVRARDILNGAGVRNTTRRLNNLTDRERTGIIGELTDHAHRRAARRSATNGGPIQ